MKTKYEQLADKLREDIFQGIYQKGEMIPSENKLQKETKFSRYTVRQAIAVLADEGLLVTERGSGTYVAQALNEKGQKTVGVIMTYLSDYIFPSIIRGIEKELSKKGYSILLGTTNNNHAKERECLERMMTQNVAGLIVEPTKSNEYNPNLSYYAMLDQKNIPLLMINAYYEELEVPHICVDDSKSGYLATKYLIDQGHEKLLLVNKLDDLQGKYRRKGYFKAMQEAGLVFSDQDIVTYTTETKESAVQMIVQKLTKADRQYTAVVAYNDEMANFIINALDQKGLAIPQKLSIIGNDDSSITNNKKIGLTTLTHPKEKMGELAAKRAIDMITGKKAEDFYFEPELIEKESVCEIK